MIAWFASYTVHANNVTPAITNATRPTIPWVRFATSTGKSVEMMRALSIRKSRTNGSFSLTTGLILISGKSGFREFSSFIGNPRRKRYSRAVEKSYA